MEVTRSNTYPYPVYDFPDPDPIPGDTIRTPEDWIDAKENTVTDDTRRIEVQLETVQSGTNQIRAITRTADGNRINHYRFRITDSNHQWCAFIGDDVDEIPVSVLHAVHRFGYGIEGHPTMSPVIPLLTELLEICSTINAIEYESSDIPLLTNLTTEAVDGFRYLYSYYIHDKTARSLSDNTTESAFESDDTVQETVPMDIKISSFTADDGDLLAADFVSPSKVARYLFTAVGDNEYAYIRPSFAPRPHPKAVTALQDAGYDVVNSASIGAIDDRLDAIEHASVVASDVIEFLDPPEDTAAEQVQNMYEQGSETPTVVIALYILTALYETTPEQTAAMLNDLTTSMPGVDTVQYQRGIDLGSAVENVDADASRAVLEQVRASDLPLDSVQDDPRIARLLMALRTRANAV